MASSAVLSAVSTPDGLVCAPDIVLDGGRHAHHGKARLRQRGAIAHGLAPPITTRASTLASFKLRSASRTPWACVSG